MTDTRHLLSMVFLFISFAFPNWCPGQGTVIFSNYAAPGLVTNGLTAQPAEVGTTFSVGLYFAQDGVTDAALFLQIGSPIHVILPGVFNGRTYTAPTLIPGGFGMFQVRVWETSFGSTYEEALANGSPQNGRLALA